MNKRILMRFGIYEFNYPFDEEKDSERMYEFIKDNLRKFSLGKVIIFNNLKDSDKFSRNAILNPNLLKIEDLYG